MVPYVLAPRASLKCQLHRTIWRFLLSSASSITMSSFYPMKNRTGDSLRMG